MHPDLADLADEINPFMSENFIDMVTTLEDDDLRKENQYDEKTLVEKYYESIDLIRSAQPKLHKDVPSEKIRASRGSAAGGIKRKLTKAQLEIQASKERKELEQIEDERREALKIENERKEAEKREAARKEEERKAKEEAERKEAARKEAARIEAERKEAERRETERKETARK